MPKALAAFNINFDSLYTIISQKAFKEKQRLDQLEDPCFFAILDRFLKLADQYSLKYSVYAIGRDLENQKNASRMLSLFQEGHEIGNHSYSHLSNLGELPKDIIRQEIEKSHQCIKRVLNGYEPKGFIAPAWSTSRNLIEVLIEQNYVYDTSLFPSFWMPFIQFQLKMKSVEQYKNSISVFRKDLAGNIFGKRTPFFASTENPWGRKPQSNPPSGILCIPLPTTSCRMPVWHSLAFQLGKKAFIKTLKNVIKNTQYFYYLMHPIDLLDPEKDARQYPAALFEFNRMKVSLKEKWELIKAAMDVICEHCEITTMDKMAKSIKENFYEHQLETKIVGSC